jgi:hypothetical protein
MTCSVNGGHQMVLWMLSIAISVCLLVIAAATGADVQMAVRGHLIIAGLVSIVMALLAISETRQLIRSGATDMLITGNLMRFMGLIWAWVVLTISITYGTGIVEWSAWLPYFTASAIFAGLFLFISRLLCDAARNGRDETMLRVCQYMAGITLFAMVMAIAFYGLNRLNTVSAIETGTWAADNVFFFGAFALAAVSAYLLKASVNEAR